MRLPLPMRSLRVDSYRLVETALMALPPLFILWTLRAHLSPVFLGLGGAGTIALVLAFRSQSRSISWWIPRLLLVWALAAFSNGIWNLYHISDLRMLTDSRFRYIPMSRLPLDSLRFWLTGETPFVTPLIIKIFQRDLAAINRFFILSFLTVTVFFTWTVSLFPRRANTRILTIYLGMLLFLNQSTIGYWMTYCHSEIPALLTMLIFFSVFALLFRFRDYLYGRTTAVIGAILLLSVSAILFSFSRDTHMFCLLAALPFVVPIFRRPVPIVVTALLICGIFLIQKAGMASSGRWRFPLTNVIMQRILPEKGLRRHFQNRYDLPPDKLVMPCARKWASSPCPNKHILLSRDKPEEGWVHRRGMQAYQEFLLRHPGYVISGWINHWFHYHLGIFQFSQPGLKSKLNSVAFYFPGAVSIYMALGILMIAVLSWRWNPMILFTLVLALVNGIITFHGDAMEITRHFFTADISLKIAFLLSISRLLDIFFSRRRAIASRDEFPVT